MSKTNPYNYESVFPDSIDDIPNMSDLETPEDIELANKYEGHITKGHTEAARKLLESNEAIQANLNNKLFNAYKFNKLKASIIAVQKLFMERGIAGSGFKGRGIWNKGISYQEGDCVFYKNSILQAAHDNAGSEPVDGNTDWHLVLETISRSEYSEIMKDLSYLENNKENNIYDTNEKNPIVDKDTIPLVDSQDSNKTKKITWSNIKSVLKGYFDSLYPNINHFHSVGDLKSGILPVENGGTGTANLDSFKSTIFSSPAVTGTLRVEAIRGWAPSLNPPISNQTLGHIFRYTDGTRAATFGDRNDRNTLIEGQNVIINTGSAGGIHIGNGTGSDKVVQILDRFEIESTQPIEIAANRIYLGNYQKQTGQGSGSNMYRISTGEKSINFWCKPTASSHDIETKKIKIYGGANYSSSTTHIGVYDELNNHSVWVYRIGTQGTTTTGLGTSPKNLHVNSSVTFSATGTVSSSDERLKQDFESLDKFEDVFDDLAPCSFKYKNGNSGRRWLGFNAQAVEAALHKHNIETKDFAGVVIESKSELDDDYNGLEDEYGIRYDQFISLNTHMIQKTRKHVRRLENRIEELEHIVKELMKAKKEVF